MVDKLSDIRLLQMAEMLGICNFMVERMQDLHFYFSDVLMGADEKVITDTLKKYQKMMVFFKELGPEDAQAYAYGETKRVLEFYEKTEAPPINRLELLLKNEGSKLKNYIS